jgi:Fucosyltransferase, N-terminal
VWILYFLECPYHTQHVKFGDVFNWTATYRRDSDLVAPYERWTYFDDRVKRQPLGSAAAAINYAANKTRQVSWGRPTQIICAVFKGVEYILIICGYVFAKRRLY